ncbi:MAG: 50S ribosomal protein L14e [Candidatus Micrarchaeota archaeon]|nr:50S ribosomal protein L14e [Candidatus Micrarchaeota archaeon]
MPAIEVGKKYVKTKGRKAGTVVTITKIVDSNFVTVRDEKGKEKRCNITHLEPLA